MPEVHLMCNTKNVPFVFLYNKPVAEEDPGR